MTMEEVIERNTGMSLKAFLTPQPNPYIHNMDRAVEFFLYSIEKKLEKGFTYKKIQYNFIFFFFHNTIDRHIDWKGGTIMFKKYVKQFLTDESGMELLQLAIVVVITVGLIGVMTKLMNTVRENISKANDNANTEMQGILRDANSDS